MTDSSLTEVQISSIKTDGRHRKDFGDIAVLAASIEALGLLQPVGITRDHRLVFGQRRLKAFQHLGRSTIPARVIDVPAIVLAEHAENEIRKDFTVSERVEIGKAVELELGKRQGQRTDLASEGQESLLGELSENFNEVPQGRTAEIAANKAGFGNENTYRQAKTVVEKAAPELVAAMDSGAVAISTAAKLATQPAEVQRQAVADPRKAIEIAKQASAQKVTAIKRESAAIQQQEIKAEMAAMRELRAPAEKKPTPPEPRPPRDPVFDTVLPNGKAISEGDPKALWLWGWLLEYEDRFGKAPPDPETLASNFLEFMERDSRRLIPAITQYLNALLGVIHVNAA